MGTGAILYTYTTSLFDTYVCMISRCATQVSGRLLLFTVCVAALKLQYVRRDCCIQTRGTAAQRDQHFILEQPEAAATLKETGFHWCLFAEDLCCLIMCASKATACLGVVLEARGKILTVEQERYVQTHPLQQR